MNDDAGLLPGLEDCPYDLTHPVGSGGFAQVFRGVRRDTRLEAAIKVQREGPLAVERFRREIDALRRLDHPHVMPLIEADPRARWYAMPLAGMSLRDLHARSPLNWDELRHGLSSVAGALLHLHSRHLVHRDVSPQNVLRLCEGKWVLADYGLVHRPRAMANAITATGVRLGTQFFSAPEVHFDPRSARPSADAYSLGALASWFTQIPPDRAVSSPDGEYWATLINATVRYDPAERWSVSTIAAHLDSGRTLVAVSGSTAQCARCHRRAGLDGAGRCLECGFMDEN